MGFIIRRNKPKPTQNENNSFITRWTSPPKRNEGEWLQYITKSPRLAVVDRIASDLAFSEGKLFEVDSKGNERELKAHPFLDFIRSPNPLYEMTSAALWRLHQIYLELAGNGGMVIERDKEGRPAELWPIPPHWIMGTPYQGHPFYQIRTPDGSIRDIPADDVFIEKNLNPFDPYLRGIGRAESIADEVEIDEYASKFQKRFFFNDATPSIIVSMPGSNEDQRERFVAKWKERFKGFFNSHGVAAIGGEATVNKISETMKDMDMIEGRKFLRDACLEHFNVPREIMGITENSNRATSEAAQYIYAQNVLMPRLRMREDAINLQLLPAFGDNLVWRYENIVPQNEEFNKVKAIENWHAGLITKNEALALQGLATIGEAGDIYKTDMASVFYKKTENPAKTIDSSPSFGGGIFLSDYGLKSKKSKNEVKATEDGKKPEYYINDEDLDNIISTNASIESILDSRVEAAIQRTIDATLKVNEQAIKKELQKFFRYESNALQAALKTVSADTLQSLTYDADIDQFLNSLIDWDKEKRALESILTPLWQQSLDAGKNYTIQHFGISKDIMQVMPDALKPTDRIDGILKTTRERMKIAIRNGNLAGLDPEDVIANALDHVGNPERIKLIAENEAHTAVMTGQFTAMKNGGYDGKRWVSEGDERVRPSHRRVNGQIKPINEYFELPGGVKMMYPGDPEAPLKETINCRCGMVPVRLSRGKNTFE